LLGALTALIGAVSGLVIALNRVGILGGDGGGEATTQTSGPTGPNNPPLFGPNTQGGGNGQVRLEDDGSLIVTATQPGHGVRVLADQESPPPDVSLTARVSWVSGERDWSFSLICRFQNSKNFYLFGVIPGKRLYNIARYRDGHLNSLSGLQRSDAIREDENNATARCVGSEPTTLSLVVNGENVRSLTDANGIDYGNIGLRVGSSAGVVTCRFTGLVVKPL
jgi:hypothetical protein